MNLINVPFPFYEKTFRRLEDDLSGRPGYQGCIRSTGSRRLRYHFSTRYNYYLISSLIVNPLFPLKLTLVVYIPLFYLACFTFRTKKKGTICTSSGRYEARLSIDKRFSLIKIHYSLYSYSIAID